MARLTISFKESEQELYEKVCKASCSPTAFIKDVLIEHFNEVKKEKKSNDIQYDDEII